MTTTSATIDSLLSYAWNDWAATRREMRRTVTALRAGGRIDATINDLKTSGGLLRLFTHGTDPGLLRQVVAVLASRSSSSTAAGRAAPLSAKAFNPVLTRTGAALIVNLQPSLTHPADAKKRCG